MATTNTTTTACAIEREKDIKRDSYISLINTTASTPPAPEAQAPPPLQKGDTTSSPKRRIDSKRHSSNPLSPATTPLPTTSRPQKRHSTPARFPTTSTAEIPPLPSTPSKRDSYISLHSVLSSPSLPIISSLNRQCRHDSDYERLLGETSRHSSEAWNAEELTRFPTFVRGGKPAPKKEKKEKREGKKLWKEQGKKDCVLQ